MTASRLENASASIHICTERWTGQKPDADAAHAMDHWRCNNSNDIVIMETDLFIDLVVLCDVTPQSAYNDHR